MTTPASPLPVLYDAPPVNPYGNGLLLVSQVHDTHEGEPNRLLFGVDLVPYNCATGWGTWPADPCAEPEDGTLKTGQRALPDDPFAATQAWGFDSCSPDEPVEEVRARAAQNLRLHEQALLEADFAARLLTEVPTPVSAPNLLSAMAEIEVLAAESGIPAVLHISPRFVPELDALNLIHGSGPILRTRLGTTIAAGAGYDSTLGATLVLTGPTTVFRSPVWVQDTVDVQGGEHVRAAIAERTMVATFECLLGAVTITGEAP